jgi:hypothetical protein
LSRVYLAVDNCFATKRWVTPESWATILADMGVGWVEASADVELDPLHMEHTYLMRWEQQMRQATEATGVRPANFFSGHGTYATCGLLHPDTGVRHRIREEWIGETARRAGRFGAGLGFFMHAVPQADLEDPGAYRARREELVDELTLIAEQAGSVPELTTVSLEQMYSPHQPPWRIGETLELMREVYHRSDGYPLYTTLDVGHGGPQRRFLRPSREELAEAVELLRSGADSRELPYLGTPQLLEKLRALATEGGGSPASPESVAEQFEPVLAEQSHLFSSLEDSDPYTWLEAVGPYAPIIHLQQTDGKSSGHLPFTEESAVHGIIDPAKVVAAIAKGFEQSSLKGELPPTVDRIYLTLELFFPTASYPQEILRELRESVEAWREVIPEDGVELTELL